MKTSEVRSLAEDRLIAAAQEGDRRAFSELVRRYEETVYRFAFKLCREREKAEETFQDTFINVFRKLRSFDGRSKFSTWLYAIVTNSCLMRHRRRKVVELEESLEALDSPETSPDGRFVREVARWDQTPADAVLTDELRAHLDAAIEKLPAEYRIVFVLRDIEGKSTEETAAITGISQEAAKSRLRRARAFLREQLDPYMRSSDGGRP
ncbi:MAG: sigma-70 family RNA polymerase sigma factor [Bacteroidota bacterium]